MEIVGLVELSLAELSIVELSLEELSLEELTVEDSILIDELETKQSDSSKTTEPDDISRRTPNGSVI